MWYDSAGGLSFECTACGECCRREGEVFLTHEDVEALSAHLAVSPLDVEQTYMRLDPSGLWALRIEEGGACPFLSQEGRCGVHAFKPWQCRAYPFWPEVIDSPDSWLEERSRCEGIDRGRVHDPEEIAALVSGDPFLEE